MHTSAEYLISVIIPVFNDYERLKACIDALEQQSFPRDQFEIVVVDNGSNTDSVAKMKGYSNVVFCIEKKPGSYAARNKGISIAASEILAFTDSDCIPDKDWISNGVMALCSSDNVGLVGGRINFFFKNPERPNIWEIYDSITYLNQEHSIEACKFAATANMFTFKSVLKHVGFFDIKLKSGGDREWGERVFAAGYELKYTAYAIVNHPARSSLQEIQKRYKRIYGGHHQLRNRGRFILRVGSFCLDILKDLTPPVRFVTNIVKDARVPGIKNKTMVTGVHVLAKLTRACYRLRYKMGAKPTRS